MQPRTPVLRTSQAAAALNLGDRIALDITHTGLRGLPATVTAIYRDRVEYVYDATSPVFAGLRGFVRFPRGGQLW
jgi:hypothetical protein